MDGELSLAPQWLKNSNAQTKSQSTTQQQNWSSQGKGDIHLVGQFLPGIETDVRGSNQRVTRIPIQDSAVRSQTSNTRRTFGESVRSRRVSNPGLAQSEHSWQSSNKQNTSKGFWDASSDNGSFYESDKGHALPSKGHAATGRTRSNNIIPAPREEWFRTLGNKGTWSGEINLSTPAAKAEAPTNKAAYTSAREFPSLNNSSPQPVQPQVASQPWAPSRPNPPVLDKHTSTASSTIIPSDRGSSQPKMAEAIVQQQYASQEAAQTAASKQRLEELRIHSANRLIPVMKNSKQVKQQGNSQAKLPQLVRLEGSGVQGRAPVSKGAEPGQSTVTLGAPTKRLLNQERNGHMGGRQQQEQSGTSSAQRELEGSVGEDGSAPNPSSSKGKGGDIAKVKKGKGRNDFFKSLRRKNADQQQTGGEGGGDSQGGRELVDDSCSCQTGASVSCPELQSEQVEAASGKQTGQAHHQQSCSLQQNESTYAEFGVDSIEGQREAKESGTSSEGGESDSNVQLKKGAVSAKQGPMGGRKVVSQALISDEEEGEVEEEDKQLEINIRPTAEEEAFLRSLGWNEADYEEVMELSDEEISEFISSLQQVGDQQCLAALGMLTNMLRNSDGNVNQAIQQGAGLERAVDGNRAGQMWM